MRSLLLCLFAIVMAAATGAAQASERAFYQHVAGKWSGPGEIVAGKYKGTKFNCTFNGFTPDARTAIDIDGNCRVGVFSQPMNASVSRGSNGYSGHFLDGESGEGMDVVGGRYHASKLIVEIRRKDLRGIMTARLTPEDKLNITISVRVESRLIPVIGMSLDRVGPAIDDTVTSSIKN